jgi:hypothetical protein
MFDRGVLCLKTFWKRLRLLKMETDITFLQLGDERQCPPAEDEVVEDYFNHPAVDLCTWENIQLIVLLNKSGFEV